MITEVYMKKDEIYNVIEYLRKGNLLNDELQDLINNCLDKNGSGISR